MDRAPDLDPAAPPVAGWERLARRAATLPTQDAAWARAAAHALTDAPAQIVVAGPAADPRAIAPLERRHGRLELLSVTHIREPVDLLADGEPALDELCAEVLRPGLALRLERLPASSPAIAALRRAVGRRGLVRVRPHEAWPSLDLDPRWEEPGGGLAPRRRSDLRRALRRAQAAGGLEVELLAPAPAQVDALLDEAFAVEARGWKGEQGTALAHDPLRAAFYRRYAAETAARGQLRVGLLRIGGAAAAMQLAVAWGARLWVLKIGYDPHFARCSPGILLLAHAVADAAARGLEGCELLGTAEQWTRPWCTREVPTVTLIAYPARPRAAGRLARDAGAVCNARAGAALRGGLRRAAAAAEQAAAGRYLAGPELADATRLEAAYAARGWPTAVGYWNHEDDAPEHVARQNELIVAALAGRPDAQVSIKVTAIGERADLVASLLARAAQAGVGVHVDSMAPERQDAALGIVCALAADAPAPLGCTLTGRWPRSVADAGRVAAAGLRVRVVKSEWPSPEDPDRDPRRGFLEVVDALVAAGAPHVAVATHDAPVAERALALLLAAGIACELQVLHGMRAARAIDAGRRAGVPVRVYVPYGWGRVPYSVRAAPRDAHVALRLARDLARRNRPLAG
ncbi:MAG TPA: GNAT family N-acetyltransferase [Solirubrobacteraceae bacterium]|nr:GNAT family N-acetyltransferase [Solirubrobacteraceae bacterium]